MVTGKSWLVLPIVFALGFIWTTYADSNSSSIGSDNNTSSDSIDPSNSIPETDFPCAPVTIQSSDYSTWTPLEKLQFSLCYDTNDTLLELIVNKSRQMEIGDSCNSEDPLWSQIKPGSANNDYFDEFHEDVPIPPEFLLKEDSPVNARVLNELGFKKVHELLTTDNPVCEWLKPSQVPMECRDDECKCWEYIPKMINHYTVHFTVFKEQPKPPVTLEWNNVTEKCAFPKEGKDCMVQPNENKGGYTIPCYNESEHCLIVGNDAPCTLRNSMDTIQLYNIYANGELDKLMPFRLHYPVACKCSNKTPNKGPLPRTGFTMQNMITMHDLDVEDVRADDFTLDEWIDDEKHSHDKAGHNGANEFGRGGDVFSNGWLRRLIMLVGFISKFDL